MTDSRWVDWPDEVRHVAGDVLPAGFRAAGVAAGIKPSGGLDVGLLVCDADDVTSAARFTRSGTLAAPVIVTKDRCRLDGIRAVAVNSGNANAATGRQGLDEASRMQGAAAMVSQCREDAVAVCSTGVIGVPLDGRKVVNGLLACSRALRPDGVADLQAAIMTTDQFEKRVAFDLELSGGTVRVTGQCKGAGMIQPSFATMLCFVQTDAVLDAGTADRLLGDAVQRSFDRVSVDGQLSTNDTAILQCSGTSGVRVDGEDAERFGRALDAALRKLALDLVRDGEGATRVGRVVVRGGDASTAERTARAVANSPLVKAALGGGDPNWGRIVQAVGAAVPDVPGLAVDVAIEGVQVCAGGSAVGFDLDDLNARVAGPEVDYAIGLPGDGAEAEVLFSDLTYEYVRINSEYTT